MARYYRRYTKTIVKRAKKSWNVGHSQAGFDVLTFVGMSNALGATIAQNSLDTAVPTSTVVKVKNIKIYGTICLQGNAVEAGPATPIQVVSYIVYVPQIVYGTLENMAQDGLNFYSECAKIVRQHPEWVMSMKNVNVKYQGGFPGEHDITKFTQSTGKMKRNLRSGDRIMHIILFHMTSGNPNYTRTAFFDYVYNTCDN